MTSVQKSKYKKQAARDYYLEKVIDKDTGNIEYMLKPKKTEEIIPKKRNNKIYYVTQDFAEQQIDHSLSEYEKDNVGLEASHNVANYVRQGKNAVELGNQFLGKNERLNFEKSGLKLSSSNVIDNSQLNVTETGEKTRQSYKQKEFYKRKIKRTYAQNLYKKKAREYSEKKTRKGTKKVVRRLGNFVLRHPIMAIFSLLFGFLFLFTTSAFSSCGVLLSNSAELIVGSSFQSEPVEIDLADLKMTELEANLQLQINRIEEDYPGYDEYNYNLAEIGHSGITLISYLSALYTDFYASDVYADIEGLFEEMYELVLLPTEEIRTKIVIKTGTKEVVDPKTGNKVEKEYEYEDEEEYTVKILNVSLTVIPLENIVSNKLSGEKKSVYEALMQTKGLTQVLYTPLDLYWYNYVVRGYGYYIEPATETVSFNRGLDISIPTGTNIFSTTDGIVTEAAYDSHFGNYVVIQNSDGYVVKFAHLDSIKVSVGQKVVHGRLIGISGETGSCLGSELHIECMYNGEYFNPLFYFEAGEATLYGEGNASNALIDGVTPPSSYGDAEVRALMEEAGKYVGMPYVWGGSNPSTGFDCSGFVSYVYKNSGIYPLERTTAQGIYNKCVAVSSSEAKAGDIIFFTGTYHSGTPVTHVGIYCGNGIMVHAGDPIKYSRINTSYWQSHFYGFGRLSN